MTRATKSKTGLVFQPIIYFLGPPWTIPQATESSSFHIFTLMKTAKKRNQQYIIAKIN
jgi:hypothetical protein